MAVSSHASGASHATGNTSATASDQHAPANPQGPNALEPPRRADLTTALRASALRDLPWPCWPVHLLLAAQVAGRGALEVDLRHRGRLPEETGADFSPTAAARGLALAARLLGRLRVRLLVAPGGEALAESLREALSDPQLRVSSPGESAPSAHSGQDPVSSLPAGDLPPLAVETVLAPPAPEFPGWSVDRERLRLCLETWAQLAPAALLGAAFRPLRPILSGGREAALPWDDEARRALGLEGALVLDEGLGGFLPPQAALPLDPELLRGLGVDPGFLTVRPLDPRQCPVDLTRQALYRHWRLSAVAEGRPHRAVLARAARLAAELSLGKGGPEHLEELAHTARTLEGLDLKAGLAASSSLAAFPEAWREHAAGRCPEGVCRARRVAPCQERCPSGIDIPNFLSLTGRGQHSQAVSIMVQDNPLPYACGLVCPAPCEKVCLRGKVDKPIHIRAMKAVSTRAVMEASGGYPPVCQRAQDSGRRVAVVGGGPAGLSCASFLARRGHGVTLFEAMPKLGGMMRYGIPEYRLPKALLDAEMATVTDLGVEVRLGQALGRDFTLDDLPGQGFSAVFLGLGAWTSRALGLEGEKLLAGVVSGTEFLVELGLGRAPVVGRRVIVVGGGNTAMDCARTAVRLGADEVRVVYRRSRAEMPAAPEEVEEAQHEGVLFTFLAAPTQLVGREGSLAGMEVVTMALGDPDASGRRRPEPKKGTERVLPCDMIISAIGQFCDESFAQGQDGTLGEVCLTRWKTIQIDPKDLSTGRPGVFAGGDAAQGPATVVEAIRDGKRAAAAIDAFLRGQPFDPAEVEPRPRWERQVICSERGCGWSEHSRPDIPMLPVSARGLNFEQVELGLTPEMAETEARRCLRCDVCIGCGLCQLVCSEAGGDALRFKEVDGRLVFEDFDRPTEKCLGCGACTRICPTGAMRMVLEKGEAAIAFTGHSISELHAPHCQECGQPLPAAQYLEHLKKRMGEQLAGSSRMDQELCPDCARKARGVRFVAGLLKG